uniref:Uncharacterized protein n=1 Tax=Oryza glumipatula TaxID=40148 RepID=A0A1V1H5J2_9ORYZ|nr:hypothetical protein [Oryza glumipatula]
MLSTYASYIITELPTRGENGSEFFWIPDLFSETESASRNFFGTSRKRNRKRKYFFGNGIEYDNNSFRRNSESAAVGFGRDEARRRRIRAGREPSPPNLARRLLIVVGGGGEEEMAVVPPPEVAAHSSTEVAAPAAASSRPSRPRHHQLQARAQGGRAVPPPPPAPATAALGGVERRERELRKERE